MRVIYCFGIFVMGVILGGIGFSFVQVNTETQSVDPLMNQHLLYLMNHSTSKITDEHWACETLTEPTVGHVLTYLVSDSLVKSGYPATFDCVQDICSFSISDCRLWKSQECSTIFLKYKTMSNAAPDVSSVECIMMP
jgi:hypothetical protein